MALVDYLNTRKRIIEALKEKGRRPEWLQENMLEPGENVHDLFSLIAEMKDEGKIHNHYGYIHLVTEESEQRRQGTKTKPQAQEVNAWAWYMCLPENNEDRVQLRKYFTKGDAKVFRTLASIIMNERPARVGERVAGPATEDELRYISYVNERLMAYIDKKREQGG